MSDLSLTYEELDDSLHAEVKLLAKHFVDLLNGSSEWPTWKYDEAVQGAAEAILEFVVDLTVDSLETSQLDRVQEDRTTIFRHRQFARGLL